jgi:hypothetical protein
MLCLSDCGHDNLVQWILTRMAEDSLTHSELRFSRAAANLYLSLFLGSPRRIVIIGKASLALALQSSLLPLVGP